MQHSKWWIRFAGILGVIALGATTVLVVGGDLRASDEASAKQQQPRLPQSFEEARSRYQSDLQRPSLFIRTRTTERMAAFRDPRGFDLLARRYTRPTDEPQDHVKYTTATILGHYYGGSSEFVEKWSELLGNAGDNVDSWLWYQGQRALARNGQTDAVLESLNARRLDPFLRAATIEALASVGRGEVLSVLVESLSDRRQPRGVARMLQIESAASALHHLRHMMTDETYQQACELVIRLLEDRRLEERSRLVIVRHLKAIFNEPEAWDDAETWLQLLRQGASQEHDPTRRGSGTGVTFFNMPAIGTRLAFVIDFSCSMLIPLTAGERDELRGPVTGGGGQDDEEEGLPWDRITNRFELAREELKRSLRSLPDGVMFCVIVYGTEAKFLETTQRLMPANRNTVRAVINELDSFRIGPPEPETGRPHGRLLGNTNMHGGLMRAFQVTDRGRIDQYEHVDPQGFDRGVDTIFHLSDGTPSYDDFAARDRREPEDRIGDPETGEPGPEDADFLIYRGPYGRFGQSINFLLEDVRRMNLHRKVEIHNIGIGEAERGLIEQISRIGMGTTRFVGGGSSRRR